MHFGLTTCLICNLYCEIYFAYHEFYLICKSIQRKKNKQNFLAKSIYSFKLFCDKCVLVLSFVITTFGKSVFFKWVKNYRKLLLYPVQKTHKQLRAIHAKSVPALENRFHTSLEKNILCFLFLLTTIEQGRNTYPSTLLRKTANIISLSVLFYSVMERTNKFLLNNLLKCLTMLIF